MAGRKEHFRIKLVAGDNVISVDGGKYESELFTPQIVNGRITLVNIIPNRRCCQIIKVNVMDYKGNNIKETRMYLKEQNRNTEQCVPLRGHDFPSLCAPLANSTPAGGKVKNTFRYRSSSTECSLPTPEPVRKALPARSKLFEKSLFNLHNSANSLSICHNHTESTSMKVGRLTSAYNNSMHFDASESILNSNFSLEISPSMSSSTTDRKCVVNSKHSTAVNVISKWQKVLTPVRTYTKNSKTPLMLSRPVLVNNTKKIQIPSKYKPTYLFNPTQGPNVTQQIELRKRKLIIDSKVCISPKSFKKQQSDTLLASAINVTTMCHSFLSFHKPLSLLQTMNMTAFDLLTNSNHSRIMTSKLNNQFRRACVNKASTTCTKYKMLSIVPHLQEDEQVLELSTLN